MGIIVEMVRTFLLSL